MKNPAKKFLFFVVGAAVLLAGIVLVLLWWPEVVRLFKGAIGLVLAVLGMVLLSLVRG